MAEMTNKELAAFGPYEFYPEDTDKIDLRIAMMPKGKSSPSVYLVFASPKNAKEHNSAVGPVMVESIWPESCIAMISEVAGEEVGSKEWDVRPVLRNSSGWRKKPIARCRGRHHAAFEALAWLARENYERASTTERRQHRARKRTNIPKKSKVRKEATAMAESAFLAYMMTYDNFASSSREVSTALGIAKVVALRIGKVLEEAGLVCIEAFEQRGGMRVSGARIKKSRGDKGRYEPDTWQCYETYDSIDRAQAIDLFIEKLPGLANDAKQAIAEEMRVTRKDANKEADV